MNKPAAKSADKTFPPAEEPIPGHDAWVREQVETAIKAKREGTAKYTPLREIAAKFGFNAR